MRLGWRHPRPNDFADPNLRALRDTFGSIQKFMTWPWDSATISGNPGVAFTVMTLTQDTAARGQSPHNLVRANTFQTPREFDSYLAVGVLNVAITGVGGASIYTALWRHNGVTRHALNCDRAGAGTVRMVVPLILPCSKGDTFDIQTSSSGGATTLVGGAYQAAFMFFLPFT